MDVREQIAAWGRRSRAERVARLAAAPSELTAALATAPAAALSRRPAPEAWAPVEVVCHLRDLEESFRDRLALILTSDEPRFPTTNPGRWAVERQYLRQDAVAAADAFDVRRAETLALLEALAPDILQLHGRETVARLRDIKQKFGLPVMKAIAVETGCHGAIVLRPGPGDAPFVTDQGNLILDCAFGTIPEPEVLAFSLKRVPGVVEHGLFLGLADLAIVAGKGGVRALRRAGA